MDPFDLRKCFILGLGFFGVSILWSIYNAYVPVFLETRFALSALSIGFMLGLGGMAWALVNVNSLPLVLDTAPQERLGTSTGLYYLFATLAAFAGPIANGWIIDRTGRNYNMILAVAPFFMVLAVLLMLGVRKGEALGASR